MNRSAVGRASRLPLGRLAPQSLAGETPAQTAGTAAPLQNRRSSWSQCIRKCEWRLSRKRSAELQLRPVQRAKDTLIAPGWSPALRFRSSWSQGLRKSERKLSPRGTYLITRVRPSSAAANPPPSSVSDISQVASFSSVSAPEDGRTPLNTYRRTSGEWARRAIVWGALVAVSGWLFTLSSRADELTVFSAASLSDALKESAGAYERKTGDKIAFNFGASSMLARQIQEGAPADVFFSADESRMDVLEKAGLILKETRRSRLSNSLVIVVTGDSPLQVRSAEDLADARVKRIALADPQAVPAGVYARAYLERAKIWPAVQRKIVPTENVRAALAAVESGNVDAGIVYKTDAAVSAKIRVAYAVKPEEGPEISYPMAVVKESVNNIDVR